MCDGRSCKGTLRTVLKRKSQRLSGQERSSSPQRMGLSQEQKICFPIGNWKESGPAHLSKQIFEYFSCSSEKAVIGFKYLKGLCGMCFTVWSWRGKAHVWAPWGQGSGKGDTYADRVSCGISISLGSHGSQTVRSMKWKKPVLSQKHARETKKVSNSNSGS